VTRWRRGFVFSAANHLEADLTGAARPVEDLPMFTVRGHVVRCALLAAALFSLGCHGKAKAPVDEARAPVDEKLAWPAIDERSLLASIATEGFTLGAPVPLAIAPDGAVLFRRSKPQDPSADLYQLDPAGKASTLATAAALLGAAPVAAAAHASAARGIDAIELSDDGARVLIPLAGRLFVTERATGASHELAIGPHRDPHLSPDGTRVAFVRDGDLWVAPVGAPGNAPPTRLTQHPADREYATPEAVAPELGRTRGYWWSPDSQSIVFQRTDARPVETSYLADPRHPAQPPVAVKLPRSGKDNAIVDLGIVSVRGGAPRWITWELARYPYLARVIWPAKGPLTLIVVGREQTVLDVLAVDAVSGATRVLLVDKDPAWIDVAPEPLRWLDDGAGFLWMTEASGAWSLERYAADGTHAGTVVTADVGLRRIAGTSADGRELIIETTAEPREQHVLRVPLAGGPPVALTSDGGVHRALAGHGVLVLTSARRAGGRVTEVVRADGARVELPSLAPPPALAPPTTKIEVVTLDDHLQEAAVTRPRSFDPKVRYPVLLRIDAEPGGKAVLDALDTYLVDQWYADAGFIVVRTDGRGTRGHERTWERVIAGDVLTLPMNDQIGALKRLGARHPELDLGRVGVLGAGYSGNLATLAVLLHPDVFAAGVAVSPITDWELLPTAYSERYMKAPAMNPEGYRRLNASSYAEQLRRPLLLLHGVTDERIVFAHTLTLLEALSAAGKHVEVGTLPATPDAKLELAGQKLTLEFLREHLGPPVRPAVMPATRSEEEEEEEEREHARGHAGSDKDRAGDKDQDRR
jgi:dipeptidyl-peptidase-4